MLRDYLLLRGHDADKLRIQRTVESFHRGEGDRIAAKQASGRPQDLLDADNLLMDFPRTDM